MTKTEPHFRARTRIAILVAALLAGTSVAAPAAAGADPMTDPCSLSVTFLCHFVPMAPDWEGDIDLTRDAPPADPTIAEPESREPADYCVNGCS